MSKLFEAFRAAENISGVPVTMGFGERRLCLAMLLEGLSQLLLKYRLKLKRQLSDPHA